jgi:membrane-bound lytic murein transglycosylase D
VAPHPLIDYYIEKYTSEEKLEWLQRALSRRDLFRELIYRKVEAYGLPWEINYLPIVESACSPYAVSRSGAVGVWQFMQNSVAPYDLRINEWLDERRDFWKSTDAALQKLQHNYTYLDDWLLAIAAYNCGLTRMRTIVKKTGARDYWQLLDGGHLPRETAHFIPKLLAIIHICSQKTTYNLPVRWERGMDWERIELDRQVDIRIVAQKAGIDASLLTMGNAELHYHITPPPSMRYFMKVPALYSDEIREVLCEKDGQLIRFHIYTVRSGDTMYELAQYYGVSVKMIRQYNPNVHPSRLRIGSTLVIPALLDVEPYRGGSGLDQEIEFSNSYLVRKGDSLWSIARKHDITPELLARKNSLLLDSVIRAGQRLKVPELHKEAWEQ